MNEQLILSKLEIKKAKEEDWKAILVLLEEAGLAIYMTGKETHKNFYVVQDFKAKNLICCFVIDFEDKTGILKSFAIKKDLQGQGIGKIIANKIPKLAKELGLENVYASSWESPGFWQKTDFNEINEKEATDKYFLKYVNYLETNFPQYTDKRKHFLLKI